MFSRKDVESTRISEPDLFSDCIRLVPIRRCQLTISKASLVVGQSLLPYDQRVLHRGDKPVDGDVSPSGRQKAKYDWK